MKVLHVNDEPLSELGGVTRYLERLLAAQEVLGVETRLLTGAAHHTGVRRLFDFWDPAARAAVERAAREHSADVVHLHSVLRESSVSVTALRSGLPIVMSVHDPKILGETDHGGRVVVAALDRWVKSPWERAVARRTVDLFLPVSEELTRRTRAAGLSPAEWLPGPTMLPDRALRAPSDCTDVLFVGRLAADKGVEQLIAAWPQVSADPVGAGLRLRIVGDGPRREAAHRLARSLGINVHFDGALDARAVSAAFGEARLVVLPYLTFLRQASSLTTLEAAAHRRPVIVGDDPAVVEILDRLGGGSAVDATQVDALATLVLTYLHDPKRCDDEGASMSQAVLECYGPEAVARRSIELYSLAIGGC